ncbi:MAG: hypothetical protein ABIP48_17795 [Planctomycetota bacterium]
MAEPFAEPIGPPRLRPMKKGRRLVKKLAVPKLQVSPEQRALILDTWRRSGLPAADFSTIVVMGYTAPSQPRCDTPVQRLL